MATKQRVNFATYPQDYYTGAQARIYFGSVWVDDIATIQYQTSHSKTPLYGYGDHQFRTVIKGQFMVRGSFTVAFKETGYLFNVLQAVKKDNAGVDEILNGIKTKNTNTYINHIAEGKTIEQIADNALKEGSTSDFEDLAEAMEDTIWGKNDFLGMKRLARSDELDYEKYNSSIKTGSDIDRDGFDILLTFGNYKAGNDSAEHTMISINDVHITGESMVVSPSAEPIGITFEFFARGLNEKVTSAWPGDDQIAARAAAKEAEKTPPVSPQAPSTETPNPGASTDVTGANSVQGPPIDPNAIAAWTADEAEKVRLKVIADNTIVPPVDQLNFTNPYDQPRYDVNNYYQGAIPTPLESSSTPNNIPMDNSSLAKPGVYVDPTSAGVKDYIKAKQLEAKLATPQHTITPVKKAPATPDVAKTTMYEPIPKNLDPSSSFVVGPISKDKDVVWAKAKVAAPNYTGTFLRAQLTLTGGVKEGSVSGRVTTIGGPLVPWYFLNATYKLYNNNTLVFTDVYTKRDGGNPLASNSLGMGILKSAMSSFFNGL